MSRHDHEQEHRLDHVRRFYARQVRFYDLTRRFLLPDRRTVIEQVPQSSRAVVLDVGHGTGMAGEALSTLTGKNGVILGVDVSLPMLQQTRRKKPPEGTARKELIVADAAFMPLKCPVDVAIFSYSLTMIPEWETALDEAHRLLRPGGFISVVDFRPLDHYGFPIRHVLGWWFRSCHCHPERRLIEALDRRFDRIHCHQRGRAHHFLYLGKKQ